MDNPNCNTEHRKFQHLTAEERHEIEVRFNKDKWTIYQIAKQLCRPFNTIKNEIKRGLVLLYHGTVQRYSAKKAEQVYLEHRSHCRKQYKRLATSSFIQYVEEHFKDGWSLDACVGRAEIEGLFPRDQMVCTKTLYNYVDAGFLGIKNIDLPYKLSRNTKPARIRQNKRILGDSISERPEEAETRQEFGHWEIDTVRGVKKETEPAVLTLVERKSRYSIWLKIMSATAASVQEGMRQILTHFGERAQQVFKTITGDNGSEFAELFRLTGEGIGIYFTHPYSSWEKGTNERHNGLLRRFIPKGKPISGYTTEDIQLIGDWANNLPRRILGYKTPEEVFERALDQIYAL